MSREFRALIPHNLRLPLWLVGGKKSHAYAAALVLTVLIALLDFATGYEIRLAVLYLLPIALATWVSGVVGGMILVSIAVLCWAVSFYADNFYSREIFYIWEGCVLAVTFAVFVLLLNRLCSALHNADRRFRDVLDGLSAAVYAVGERSGTVLYANRYLVELLQTDPVGSPGTVIDGRFNKATVEASATEPRPAATRFRHDVAHDEQTGRWYLVQSGHITWETGERVQLVVLMDITEQQQASALRQQHQDMLHNTARFTALAEMASMLGHEINQPLMAISTYTSAGILLLSKIEPDIAEAKIALEKAMVQVTRSSDIVERTRGFLRRRMPAMSTGDVNSAVRSAVQSLELDLQDPTLSFRMTLGANLPIVVFDRILIEQVVVNLLTNALDAVRDIPANERWIDVMTDLARDGSVRVAVRDSGAGLDAEADDALYRPFYTTKADGLGLGLAICRSVIEAHTGRLWHDAETGKGTTFQFTLPDNGP